MGRLFGTKHWILILSSISLAALSGLAIGLRNITFRSGQVLGSRESVTIQYAVSRTVDRIQDVHWWDQLVLWALLFCVVLVIGVVMTPEGRRRLIQGFIRLAAIFWAIYFVIKYNRDLLLRLAFGFQISPENAQDAAASAPPPVFEPPQVSPALIFLISLALAILLTFLILRLYRGWKRWQAMHQSRRPLDEIAGIARDSLADLSAGYEPGNVVVNCYVRMSRALRERRGLYRREAMTATEFAARLEGAGVPVESVHGLTRLFEGVRYGAHASSRTDVKQAVACLNDILRSCGETV